LYCIENLIDALANVCAFLFADFFDKLAANDLSKNIVIVSMANSLKIASKGEGMPIVFIHGWGVNSGVWQFCVEYFSKKCQVITVDLPGFGSNSHIQLQPYTIKHIAETIQQQLHQPAVIIGWSLGGLVATEIAHCFKNKVTALVTIASSPLFIEANNWPGIKANVLQLFHRQLAKDTGKTIDNFLKIQAMGSPHIRNDIKKIQQLVMAYSVPTEMTLANSLSFLQTTDQRQKLACISQPFLRLYGANDSLVPKAVISQIDELAVNSDKIIFDGASHAPFISHLDLFNESLMHWLLDHSLV
jgi:pimeloyl-[acyl-carrier protein] methyl ester esterase